MPRVLHLVQTDLQRLLTSKRFHLAVGVSILVAIGLLFVVYMQTSYRIDRNACHATVQVLSQAFLFLLPLVAGLAAGDLLAVDRSLGYTWLLLPRCTGRVQYVAGKALAMAAALALAIGVIYAATLAVAAVFYPLVPPPGQAEGVVLPLLPDSPLFARHPLGYVCLRWGLHTLAATTLAWLGLLASLWVKTPYVVGGVPFAVCYGSTYALLSVEGLSPEFLPLFLIWPDTPLAYAFTYWATGGVILLGLVLVLSRRVDFGD